MTNRKLLSIALLFVLVSASCKKEDTQAEPNYTPPNFAINSNLAGHTWVLYQYVALATNDTFQVNDTIRFLDGVNYTWNDSAWTYTAGGNYHSHTSNMTFQNSPFGQLMVYSTSSDLPWNWPNGHPFSGYAFWFHKY